ncbi:hypothetical protein [Phenylobacterium sp.]|uniref:hypothetical protein n=1 Tax=Phenylobacterium sp. TaxID=1871053 RepID=UPI002735FFCA|nr:hypothetical protein [Phenylobacterium sp.]MDP3853791.1 hypothetical protein [Phenylobacterium sp.]
MRALLLTPVAVLAAGCGSLSEGQAERAHASRIQEAVSAYETARRGGDILDMCVKAKLTAIAYEDAKQSANHLAWKARESEDCRAAYAAMAPAAE